MLDQNVNGDRFPPFLGDSKRDRQNQVALDVPKVARNERRRLDDHLLEVESVDLLKFANRQQLADIDRILKQKLKGVRGEAADELVDLPLSSPPHRSILMFGAHLENKQITASAPSPHPPQTS
jgi:hypothetical protein